MRLHESERWSANLWVKETEVSFGTMTHYDLMATVAANHGYDVEVVELPEPLVVSDELFPEPDYELALVDDEGVIVWPLHLVGM